MTNLTIETKHYISLVNKFFLLKFTNYETNKHYTLAPIVAGVIVRDSEELHIMMKENIFYRSLTPSEQMSINNLIQREQLRLSVSPEIEIFKHLLSQEIIWHTRDIPYVHIVPFMSKYVNDIISKFPNWEWMVMFTNKDVCYNLLKRYIEHDDVVIKNIAKRISSDTFNIVDQFNVTKLKREIPVNDLMNWLHSDNSYCYKNRMNRFTSNLVPDSMFKDMIYIENNTPVEIDSVNTIEQVTQIETVSNLFRLATPFTTFKPKSIEV